VPRQHALAHCTRRASMARPWHACTLIFAHARFLLSAHACTLLSPVVPLRGPAYRDPMRPCLSGHKDSLLSLIFELPLVLPQGTDQGVGGRCVVCCGGCAH
jgi:hypothetical protein